MNRKVGEWVGRNPSTDQAEFKQMKVKRETLIIVVLGMLTAIGSFSIDMYLPGFPAIGRASIRISPTSVLPSRASSSGYRWGSWGTDRPSRFGRIGPVVFGMSVYVIAAIGCAFSPSINYLIAMRFFLAIGACVGMVAASAIIRDLFSGKEVARALSMQITVSGIALSSPPPLAVWSFPHSGGATSSPCSRRSVPSC